MAPPSQEKSSFYVTLTSFCYLLIASELTSTETCVAVKQTVLLPCVVSPMSGRVVLSPYRKALPSAICTVNFLPDLYRHCPFLTSASLTILFERTASSPALSSPYLCHWLFPSVAPSITHLLADRLPEVCMQWGSKDCEGSFALVLVLIGWLFTCVADFLSSLSLCSVPGIKPSMCKAFNKC